MKTLTTKIPGVLVIEPKVWGDARGFFLETWQSERYAEAGAPLPFVQDNLSLSRKGVLRGLHIQSPNPQGKLVSVLRGAVFDVAVDVRRGSPTFGQWFGLELSAETKHQLYVPPGLAHGFVVTSDEALFFYKCTDYYSPKDELTIAWNDPDIGVAWPTGDVTLSGKDQQGLRLKDVPAERLAPYRAT